MANVLSDDEILRRVRTVLIDALGVDDADILPESRIVTDLEAQWPDLLDIGFRLNRAFSLVIPTDHLFPKVKAEMVDAEGRLTNAGIDMLYANAPQGRGLLHLRLEPGTRMADLQTVAMICRYVKGCLMKGGEAAGTDDSEAELLESLADEGTSAWSSPK